MGNWLECIRSREPAASNIELASKVMVIVDLATREVSRLSADIPVILDGVEDPEPTSLAGKAKIFFRPYAAPAESPATKFRCSATYMMSTGTLDTKAIVICITQST